MCLFQAAAESYLISNGSILSLFILFCIHNVAFSKIFDDMILKWNGHDNEKSIIDLVRFRLLVKKWVRPWKNCLCLILMIQLNHLCLSFYCRWFLKTAEIYSPIIMIQLMNSMFVVALSLFQLNLVWPSFVLINCWKYLLILYSNSETPTTWLRHGANYVIRND